MRLTDLTVPDCGARGAVLDLLLCSDRVLAALDDLDAAAACEWRDRMRCPIEELRSLYFDFSDTYGPDGHDSAPDDAPLPRPWAEALERLIVAAGAPGLDAHGIAPEWRATFRHFAARLCEECGGAVPRAATPRGPSRKTLEGVRRMADARAAQPAVTWRRLARAGGFRSAAAARKAWARYGHLAADG